ncbi:MAG TPA: sigma factor-like helix-turn-helix DNA-binding protein, partial [Candidatus Acidoferrum sp.]
DNAALREAIRLAQQGDGSAFEFLYRLYCPRVYALCLRMVREASEAEDLTQEAFLQLFRKIHTFRGESAFSDLRLTGLFDRVNLKTAIDWLPERCKAMFLLHHVQGHDLNEIAEILGCAIGTPKSQLHRARTRLRKLLNKLQCHVASQNLDKAGCPLATVSSRASYESAGAA